jgi:predicted PurR-regulated permease PerM
MGQINWQRTRDILICIICIGIIGWSSISILSLFVDAIIILLLAMAVAFLITPLVNLQTHYGMPRVLATLLTYVIVLAVIVGFGYELIFSLIQQAVTFSDTIVNFATDLPKTFQDSIKFLENQGVPYSNIQKVLDQVQSQAYGFATTLTNNALNFIFTLTNALLSIFLVAVLSFYLVLDGKRIRDSIISISPRRMLSNVLLFEDALNRVVGNYIRGQLTLAIIVGIFTGTVCFATGLGRFALVCGVLAFLFETIPMVGPGLASIIPILLSLLLPGPFPRTFEIVACFVVIQILESNVLGPRIVGHAVGLHPVAAILALLIGAKLFGVFGALLSTPIVAAAWVVIASLYRSIRGESPDDLLGKKRNSWPLRPNLSGFIGARRRPPHTHERGPNSSEEIEEEPTPDVVVTPSDQHGSYSGNVGLTSSD